MDDKREGDYHVTEHYVCLGDCNGATNENGVCMAPECKNHNDPLVRCNCTDGKHFDFKPPK